MAQEVVIPEIRSEAEARSAKEPWWPDWVRLRTLIETSRVPEARVLVKELAEKWPDVGVMQHYARVLEPPVVREVPSENYDPRPDYAWLREHAHQYSGCWLAVYEGRLIAADPDRGRVVQLANAAVGPSKALFIRAPEPPRQT